MTTTRIIQDKQQYLDYIAAFKQKARNKNLSPADMMLYHLIRGHRWSTGFSPLKDPGKIANAPWTSKGGDHNPMASAFVALQRLETLASSYDHKWHHDKIKQMLEFQKINIDVLRSALASINFTEVSNG